VMYTTSMFKGNKIPADSIEDYIKKQLPFKRIGRKFMKVLDL